MPERPCLMSGEAAFDLICGDPKALGPTIFYTLFRASLIGVGLYAIGQRQHVVKSALAGALAIEASVLLWATANRRHCPLPSAAPVAGAGRLPLRR